MIIKKRIFSLMLAAACGLGATAAIAADYEPPVFEAPADEGEYVPVEVGSGWYLRGDVAYNFQKGFKDSQIFADDFIIDDSLMPYNVGSIGLLDMFSYSEKDLPVSAGIGIGYHFSDYLRADVNFSGLSSEKYSMTGHLWSGDLAGNNILWHEGAVRPEVGCLGTRETTDAGGTTTEPFWGRDCDIRGSATQRMYDGTANLYVDLGTFAGITPYVGGGVGVIYSRNKLSGEAFCENGTNVTGGVTRTFDCAGDTEGTWHEFINVDKANFDLLYALNAGFAYKISANTSLDVGYTYKTAPGLENWAISEQGIEKRKGYDLHQVRVGLRYDLW